MSPRSYVNFFSGVGKSIGDAFRKRVLRWHLVAIVLTFFLVVTGFDWWFFTVTRGSAADALGMAAGTIGFFTPVAIPAAMYLIGALRKDRRLQGAAIRAFRAVAVAFIIIAAYKALTGRIQPEFLARIAADDVSRNFNFGFWRNGIFWGWPSSHTAVAFALSVFLTLMYQSRKWVGALALVFATFIATGAAVSFHWFSDVVAGIIVGALVGVVVFREGANA